VPCRPDARCRHPAFRSLDAGSFSASLPSLASNAGSTARAHPSRTRIPRAIQVEAHRREPVWTAGRWAIPAPGSPQTAHHPLAQNAITTTDPRHFTRRTAGRWAIPAPGSPQTAHHPLAQNAITTTDPRHFTRRTAGRWAIPAPGGPQTAHHQPAQYAITTSPAPGHSRAAPPGHGPGRAPRGDPAGQSRHGGLIGPSAPRHHVPRSQQPSQPPPSQQQQPQSAQVQTPSMQQPQQSHSGQDAPLASGARASAAHKTSPDMNMLLGNV
jgi:hypothetical protein